MERWGAAFDPDRLADLETAMWKAYYRRQPARLFGLLILGLREQGHASWPRAVAAAFFLTKGAARFARAAGGYDGITPDIARGYRILGLPPDVDAVEVARRELRWWAVRREIGLAAGSGTAAGHAIARLYATIYGVAEAQVAEAGRLRGEAAAARDRGATGDPDGPTARGLGYWPDVACLLRRSYRELHRALADPAA